MAVLLLLAGVLDAGRVHDLESELDALVDRPSVVLDMREVTRADTALLGLLSRFAASRTKTGTEKITLVIGANSFLDRLLCLDDIHRGFRIVWDLSDVPRAPAEEYAAAV